jgi:hypothetical protein
MRHSGINSPLDWRSVAGSLQHEVEQAFQVGDRSVRPDPQLFRRLSEPVHPHSGKAERLRAGRVPAAERREHDALFRDPQAIDRQLVRVRIRLVGAIVVGADERVEQRRHARVRRVRPKHRRTEVGERNDAYVRAAQRPERVDRIGPRRQMQIGVHQLLLLRRGQRDVQGRGTEDQGVLGDAREVDVSAGHRSQPRVLELACPPQFGERASLSRERALDG